jgi:hypothetical protein
MMSRRDMAALKRATAVYYDQQRWDYGTADISPLEEAVIALRHRKIDTVVKLAQRFGVLAEDEHESVTRLSDLVELGERLGAAGQRLMAAGRLTPWRTDAFAGAYALVYRVIDYALECKSFVDDLSPEWYHRRLESMAGSLHYSPNVIEEMEAILGWLAEEDSERVDGIIQTVDEGGEGHYEWAVDHLALVREENTEHRPRADLPGAPRRGMWYVSPENLRRLLGATGEEGEEPPESSWPWPE